MNDIDLGFTLPSSPEDRKKIKRMIEECSGQLQMIDDRKASIKETIAAIHEDYKIPKKVLSKAIQIHHKNNFAETSHDNSVLEMVVEGILGQESSPAPAGHDIDGDIGEE